MIETPFTRLLGCTQPIQNAPMPGIATHGLVAAVANAGGAGDVPTPLMGPNDLAAALDALAARTRGVFGASFLAPFTDLACVDVAARKARYVEFFYGEPDPAWVKRAGAAGARVGWQVGSRAEAIAAERAGCDFLIAQGTEAGGHVRGTTSLLPLLAEVLGAVRVPVLAAGGIATARELAAVLAAGAAGARLGTRFVASTESGAHPGYIAALLAARPEDTTLTEAFFVMWPNAPHRVLRACIDAAQRLADEVAGEIRLEGRALPVPRLSVISPTRETTGHVDAMALYAGESVANIDSVKSVAEIIRELCDGAEQLLRGAALR